MGMSWLAAQNRSTTVQLMSNFVLCACHAQSHDGSHASIHSNEQCSWCGYLSRELAMLASNGMLNQQPRVAALLLRVTNCLEFVGRAKLHRD